MAQGHNLLGKANLFSTLCIGLSFIKYFILKNKTKLKTETSFFFYSFTLFNKLIISDMNFDSDNNSGSEFDFHLVLYNKPI